jgi:hypothetical protein
MDVYRDQCDTSAKPQNWNWSLGEPQYNWLKNTLESSTATHKMVFAHHVRGQGRGAAIMAPYFEWGGHQNNGTYTFDQYRPGWEKPIHQLFIDTGVDIFFQGHDHLFAHEVLDNVVYQEVPMPSDSTYQIGMLANADAYLSDTLDGTGHLRITVNPGCLTVDFVRAYLPADTLSGEHHNGEVAFSYTLGECTTEVSSIVESTDLLVYPNPAKDRLAINIKNPERYHLQLTDAMGRQVHSGRCEELDVRTLTNGIYILSLSSANETITRKIVVQH